MERNDLKIEYLPVSALKPYEKNARKHGEADIEAIVRSIEEFSFLDPIGIWGKDNLIVEGHGRLEAAKQLAMETVPVIRLDHLTDEQRRAYALAHNKTAELSGWDFAALEEELAELDEMFEMAEFGFIDVPDNASQTIKNDDSPEWKDRVERYSNKVDIPQYFSTEQRAPDIEELYDSKKAKDLEEDILRSEVDEKTKVFLIAAAQRHIVFNYKKIAEFYAHQDKDVQRLMEESALVIIDINDAIKNGFCKLRDVLSGIEGEADEE